jgi:hypothetical protein
LKLADGVGDKQLIGDDTESRKIKAVSYAAYTTLVDQFKNSSQVAIYRQTMIDMGFDPDITNPGDPNSPEAIGIAAANQIIQNRLSDGANVANNYADTSGYVPVNSPDPAQPNAVGNELFDPNRWQPLRVPTGTLRDENNNPIVDNQDPSSYNEQTFLTPHWGSVTSFGMAEGDQYLPQPPAQKQ